MAAKMMNLTAYEQLQAAEMPEAQARVVASHLIDSGQLATQADVEKMRLDLKDKMSRMESYLVRWLFASTLTLLAVLTALRIWA